MIRHDTKTLTSLSLFTQVLCATLSKMQYL